jgi:hypothetical protein
VSAFRSFSQSSSIATSEPAGIWRCCPDRSCCRGVGSLAVHLAKLRGAPVIGLASEFKFDLVRGLGAAYTFSFPGAWKSGKQRALPTFPSPPTAGGELARHLHEDALNRMEKR